MKSINTEQTMSHVLNFGMGVESAALLLHWMLKTDEERGFPLDNLVVLTTQTGNEYDATKDLVERHLFPIMRRLRVRFVEIAKAGPSKKDGYVVLQDTRAPHTLNIEGYYKLSDELTKNGTLQPFSGAHKCAQKMKGDVIDAWLADEFGFDMFGPYLGYNADETKRAQKCDGYKSRGWDYRFPLIDMGWTRGDCLAYLYFHFEVIWQKSCCKFCPFQSKKAVVTRWKTTQGAAAFSAFMEHIALAFNPKMQMFSYGSAADLIKENGLLLAYNDLQQTLESSEYAIYRIRRTYERPVSQSSGNRFYRIARCVNTMDCGSKIDMMKRLVYLAQESGTNVETDDYGISRAWTHQRPHNKAYPSCEGFYVVAPAIAQDKVRNARKFEATWALISALNEMDWGDALSVEEYQENQIGKQTELSLFT